MVSGILGARWRRMVGQRGSPYSIVFVALVVLTILVAGIKRGGDDPGQLREE